MAIAINVPENAAPVIHSIPSSVLLALMALDLQEEFVVNAPPAVLPVILTTVSAVLRALLSKLKEKSMCAKRSAWSLAVNVMKAFVLLV